MFKFLKSTFKLKNFQLRHWTLRCIGKLSLKEAQFNDLNRIRNIGIIAHIDAGKTTTTERMLYYSGQTNIMGEVHDGNTVMDYMPLERERGITISSAAITFLWKNHKINLIDTPGHVDFTFEVERSLAVLDGAVTILDSSAGVEVQTLKVWDQASRYEIPSIIYLNKMDKPAADIDMCLASISNKLKIKPLMLHIPIGSGKSFHGVIDILNLKKFVWQNSFNRCDGSNFLSEDLSSETDKELYDLTLYKREKLIESIADLDDLIAEKYICNEINDLSVTDLQYALRRIVLKRLAFPVLCGSSYKNVGVQLLMNAIIHYLPTPLERQFPFSCKDNEACAYVFKIVHNKQKEPLSFLRIYSGSLKNGQKVYNLNQGVNEKIFKLSVPFANNFQEVSSVSAGNIAVVSGLKQVFTGNLLFSSASVMNTAKTILNSNQIDLNKFSVQVPNPVFFCTIEPPSAGFQKQLDCALECLQREDPTFQVENDEVLVQTILMGMGELHIDIIKERIQAEYGVEAYLGPLLVAYRETLEEESSYTHIFDKNVSGTKHYVKVTLKICPVAEYEPIKDINVIVTKENELGKLRSDHLKSVNAGMKSALNNGPIINFPVIGVKVNLLWFEVGKNTSASMISAATSQCIKLCLKNSKMHLLEPVMKLSIIVDRKFVGRVLSDLSQMRSKIMNIESRQDVEIIESKTPLSELRGYSTKLRALTSGTSSFAMHFDSYEKLDMQGQSKAIEEVTGFSPV